MKKLDLKKNDTKSSIIPAPPPNMPVGGAPDYKNALETLYGLSYTLKFMLKLREKSPIDYPIMPLEGLWWTKDSSKIPT